MERQLPYDKTNKESILTFAKQLENNNLRSFLGERIFDYNLEKAGKGGFGTLVEEIFFQYSPNNESKPDFPEAGIELKTTPLKKTKKDLVSKERLVFNIINYMEEHKESFKTSSFWKKNSELLLLFYIYEKGILPIDLIFKIVRLWRFPIEDLKIIIDDWNKIASKIREGKAHEISEGDTLYLGACTKGANKTSLREQPFSNVKAMQRAYSLKSKYLNFIIGQTISKIDNEIDEKEYEYLLSESSLSREDYEKYHSERSKDIEPVVKSLNDYKDGQTFEELIIEKFKKFIGLSEKELIGELNIEINPKAKNRYNVICNRILGIKGKYIEEFEKAEVSMKTIVLNNAGSLKESMSFQQIKYKEIINEEWLDSYLYNVLSKRFFFVVFQKDQDGSPRLKKVKFWTMPTQDLEKAEVFWEDVKNKIIAEDFNNFYTIADKKIFHVRPKAQNQKDLMETINGNFEKKKAYWLNSSYIKDIISN